MLVLNPTMFIQIQWNRLHVDINSEYNITFAAITETSDERLKEDIDAVHSDCR